MTAEHSAEQFVAKLEAYCSAPQRDLLRRYFKPGKPTRGAEDVFLEVPMNKVLRESRAFVDMPLDDVERLLASPVHELRAGALRIMGDKVTRRKVSDEEREANYKLFMAYKDKVNSWGLVDISAHHVVGGYLLDRPRDVLYEMAAADDWWEHRIALVSTLAFVRKGDLDDAFRLAEMLRHDEHDKVQTAVGWLLRDAGKHDRARLLAFLDEYAATLPRVSLRTAIEHLDKDQRAHYLGLGKQAARR
jgi:3-methyladenine DNA glycosylase AlkD